MLVMSGLKPVEQPILEESRLQVEEEEELELRFYWK